MRNNVKKIALSLFAVFAAGLFTVCPAAHAQVVSIFDDLQTAINDYGAAVGNTVITVTADFDITDSLYIPAPAMAGATLTVRGAHPGITLTRDVYGNLFDAGAGATLILQDIIIDGDKDDYPDDTPSIIHVSGGEFIMESGAVLTNNGGVYVLGGGVNVSGGTFTMTGGEISGNTAFSGGGVYVSGGTFTMTGGEISGNTAFSGGGVYLDLSFSFDGDVYPGGTFAMTGGEISGNTAEWGYGGGVYNGGGEFTMTGGVITGNIAEFAGGVFIESCEEFILGGTAVISGNSNNNVYLADGRYITLSTVAAPAPGMNVGVQTETADGVIVESGAYAGYEEYFFADESGMKVSNKGGRLYITVLSPDIQIVGYEALERIRFGATAYDYTYKVYVKNHGDDAKSVTAKLTGYQEDVVTPISVDINFGDIASGETTEGIFIIRIPIIKNAAYMESLLEFTFYY